jgi:collagenase-like PrtC family protease
MPPKLVTYCSSHETLDALLETKIHEILLEDPKLSLRSFEKEIRPGFSYLESLIVRIKEATPDIALTFNLDILPHHRHQAQIEALCTLLSTYNVTSFRIQDPGLINWIRTYIPTATFQYAAETSNQNLPSLTYFQDFVTRNILSNEVAKADLQLFKSSLSCELEIQVHGPILIQYSPRRYLASIENTEETLIRMAADQDYPGRNYVFYDNIHGHLMYLYFDRCLLFCMEDLLALNLDSWLIDGRGLPLDVLKKTIDLYAQYQPPSLDAIQDLQQISPRPLKPGFFNVNLTDQDRESPWKNWDPKHHIGTLLDTHTPKSVMLCHRPFPPDAELVCITPKGKEIPIEAVECEHLKDSLYTVPFKKGMTAKSKLFIR